MNQIYVGAPTDTGKTISTASQQLEDSTTFHMYGVVARKAVFETIDAASVLRLCKLKEYRNVSALIAAILLIVASALWIAGMSYEPALALGLGVLGTCAVFMMKVLDA